MPGLTNIIADLTNFNYTKSLILCLVLISLLLIVLIGFVCYSSCKQKNLTFDSDANQNSKNSTELELEESKDSTQKESSSEDYTESSEDESSDTDESDAEIQADEYSVCSMEKIRPYPFHGFGFDTRLIPINGIFRAWIVAKVHRIEMIDKDSKRLIVWARIQFYCFSPMPVPLIIKCRLSDELRHQPISIGNFVVVEYNAFEEFSSKRKYTIIKINYWYH
jgi:hypothetical protein